MPPSQRQREQFARGLDPPAQSRALLKALQQQGVPTTFVDYEGNHSFGGLSEQQARQLWQQAPQFLVSYTRAQAS